MSICNRRITYDERLPTFICKEFVVRGSPDSEAFYGGLDAFFHKPLMVNPLDPIPHLMATD